MLIMQGDRTCEEEVCQGVLAHGHMPWRNQILCWGGFLSDDVWVCQVHHPRGDLGLVTVVQTTSFTALA